MVRIALLLIAGIVTGHYINYSLVTVLILIVISLSVILFLGLNHAKIFSYKKYRAISTIALISIYILGILTMVMNSKKSVIPNYKNVEAFHGNIVESPVINERYIKVISKVLPDSSDSIAPTFAILYLEKSTDTILQYGDCIIFKGNLHCPEEPKNPYEFDYRNYLLSKGITHTAFISSDCWRISGHSPENMLIEYSITLRDHLLESLKKNGLKDRELSVASAILLGYDDYMEKETKLDYMKSGSMHILCVSGLHVGIIYIVLNAIMGFLPKRRSFKLIKPIVLITTIWLYASITGFSPSVQRAALMISVFIIGGIINRKSDSYNTLAISAVILLIIDPHLIFKVGFQLSYSAVLGIIIFYFPIYRKIQSKNAIADKILSITALSLAAQLGTFPIAIYYFHYFPAWFLLSNLITFPLSFLILTTGLIFIVLSWLPMVSEFVAAILSYLIKIINGGIELINMLPSHHEPNLYFSMPMVIAIYMLIIAIYLAMVKPHPILLKYALAIIMVISTLSFYHNYKRSTQHKYIIYSIKRHMAHEIISGKNQVILLDSLLFSNPSKLNFHLNNSRAIWGIGKQYCLLSCDTLGEISGFGKKQEITLFNDKVILTICDSSSFIKRNSTLNVDYLILTGSRHNLPELLEVIVPVTIVIDNSVPPWEAVKITDYATSSEIPYYHIDSEGSLIITNL